MYIAAPPNQTMDRQRSAYFHICTHATLRRRSRNRVLYRIVVQRNINKKSDCAVISTHTRIYFLTLT